MGPIYKPAFVLAQGWHGNHPSGAGRGKTATERRVGHQADAEFAIVSKLHEEQKAGPLMKISGPQ